MPLVGQQPRVNLNWYLVVEGKAASPLHKFDHNPVSDAAKFVGQFRVAMVQQISHILADNQMKSCMYERIVLINLPLELKYLQNHHSLLVLVLISGIRHTFLS